MRPQNVHFYAHINTQADMYRHSYKFFWVASQAAA